VTAGQVKMMHDAGLRIFPYGVETRKEHERMLAMKVDGVITGDPILSGERSKRKRAA
jgi:glycerophosphoryl diester phosphodiesterase